MKLNISCSRIILDIYYVYLLENEYVDFINVYILRLSSCVIINLIHWFDFDTGNSDYMPLHISYNIFKL